MQTEKLQMNFANGVEKAELIIREVKEVNELPVKKPVVLNLNGTIGAPYEFLKKRLDQPDQINQKRCHILVDREEISITLIYNENDEYNRGSVKGILQVHPKFEEFGINTGKVWVPAELGMFFKMNRTFFNDRKENMNLVSQLMNYIATVNNKIQRSIKESGDRTDNFEQVVNSNLPSAFTLTIPLFKGHQPEILEVETFAQVNGREVAFILISPAAQAVHEEIRDKAIDFELDRIRTLCQDIAIIEQ
ncbi:MAG: hypothetical protein PHW22_04215 [Bacilli bacterium]|nr:hypothetical protein [Bacilli bacterium]